jgi:SAM-dependent methyltransferase
MGTIPLSEIQSILVCPRCRARLATNGGDAYHCTDPSCAYNDRLRFPIVGGWPVLVDFEHSILTEDHVVRTRGASVLARTKASALNRAIKGVLSPHNVIAERNVAHLRRLLADRSDGPTVLVIGGGTVGSGIEALYDDHSIRLVGFDLYGSPMTQFIADGHQIPLEDESVDAVVVQAVLEHALDPRRIVVESHRVTKPGGLVYAETPFLQHVHEGPYDFTRFTESGHRYLFRNFERIDSGVVGGPCTQLQWSIEHASRSLFRSGQVGKATKGLFFWLRFMDRWIPRDYAIDCAAGVYFLGRKSDQEVAPSEMVDYYGGAQR